MYGAQVPKFTATLKCSARDGQKYYEAFWEKYKPLELFKQDLTKAWESRGGKKGGFIRGIDGRKLFARSPHSLVNLMLQNAGSVVVKVAGLFTDKWSQHLDSHQLIFYHDEYEYEVLNEHVAEFLPITEKAFKKAGEWFKLNVEIVGTPKTGKSWLEVH